jgi:hypothetical protein
MTLTKAVVLAKSLVSDSYLQVTGLPIASPPTAAKAEKWTFCSTGLNDRLGSIGPATCPGPRILTFN